MKTNNECKIYEYGELEKLFIRIAVQTATRGELDDMPMPLPFYHIRIDEAETKLLHIGHGDSSRSNTKNG